MDVLEQNDKSERATERERVNIFSECKFATSIYSDVLYQLYKMTIHDKEVVALTRESRNVLHITNTKMCFFLNVKLYNKFRSAIE